MNPKFTTGFPTECTPQKFYFHNLYGKNIELFKMKVKNKI